MSTPNERLNDLMHYPRTLDEGFATIIALRAANAGLRAALEKADLALRMVPHTACQGSYMALLGKECITPAIRLIETTLTQKTNL